VSQSVLVVDDDVQILRVLRINLEARGYLVTTSQNGSDALRFVRDNPPDIVILDLELPGTSGLEVLESLRSSSDVPVIISRRGAGTRRNCSHSTKAQRLSRQAVFGGRLDYARARDPGS